MYTDFEFYFPFKEWQEKEINEEKKKVRNWSCFYSRKKMERENVIFIPLLRKNFHLTLIFINKILYINKIIIYINIKWCEKWDVIIFKNNPLKISTKLCYNFKNYVKT